MRDEALIAMHEQTRKQQRDHVLNRKHSTSGGRMPSSTQRKDVGADLGANPSITASPGRHRRQLVARRPVKRRGVAELATRDGKTFRLTSEEKLQRESDKISNVINQLIRGRRQLYGTMIRDAESTFRAIDRDGSGTLDYGEFSTAMKRLGLGLQEKQCMELAVAMDADGDGQIDCAEFVSALQQAEKRMLDARREQLLQDQAEPEEEPAPEPDKTPIPVAKVVEETPREPSVAEMTPKQRTNLFFRAVLAQDEPTILKLLDGGVPMDVTRTNRITDKEETPMEVAVAEGKTRSVEVLQAYSVAAQQQLICMGLKAKHTTLASFTSKVQRSDGYKKRSVVALRPWRNAKAVESCTNQLAELDPSHKAQVARVLTRRAKLYIDVHAMANAVADYTAVLELCPIDPEAEFDDLRISTHVRRGIVLHFSKQDHLALIDLEKGWQLFRAKRESLRVMGEAVFPSCLLDKAAHLIHAIRFRLRMDEIDRRDYKVHPPQSGVDAIVKPVSDTQSGQRLSAWISVGRDVRGSETTLGVDLIWLLEWGIRNEIPGYADAFVKSEKGRRVVDGVEKAKNCLPSSALKAVLAVVESRVLGPLRPGLEGRVVKANRHNRVLVEYTGGRRFWYACSDLTRLPLSHDDIKRRFEAIDEDASGVLDRDEVSKVAASLGAELNDKQLNDAMEAMDEDGSGEVSLPEFIAWFEHEQNEHGTAKVHKAAYLMFGKEDRVVLNPDAAARLKAQCKLPSVHERACAWIQDHKDDDDFDDPISQFHLTTAQVVDRIIKPATQRTKQSYADGYLARPMLRKATHYVVHNPESGFWDTVHGLLLQQLGLDRSVELRELTAHQMLSALQMHKTKRGSLFTYAIDWLISPVHTPAELTNEELISLQKKTQKTAIADAGCMVLLMDSAVETPSILTDVELLKPICTGMETGAELNLTLPFSALGELSQLLWEQLAETKRKKNALSVLFGGAAAREQRVDSDAIDQQLTHNLLQLKAVSAESSEESKHSDRQPHESEQEPLRPLSWRSRRRPVNAPTVRRKEKELLAIQAERSEMKVSSQRTIRSLKYDN